MPSLASYQHRILSLWRNKKKSGEILNPAAPERLHTGSAIYSSPSWSQTPQRPHRLTLYRSFLVDFIHSLLISHTGIWSYSYLISTSCPEHHSDFGFHCIHFPVLFNATIGILSAQNFITLAELHSFKHFFILFVVFSNRRNQIICTIQIVNMSNLDFFFVVDVMIRPIASSDNLPSRR